MLHRITKVTARQKGSFGSCSDDALSSEDIRCSLLEQTLDLLPRSAMCGRLPVGKGFVERLCKAGRCGHVFDLLERCS